MGCVWYAGCYVRKMALSSVCNYWEEGYGPVWGALVCVLVGFWIWTMLANFHVWGIMFLLRTVLNILVRNARPRGPMCFRCLIFSMSGPCELLCLLCFIASWTWEVASVMLYSCMFCVALSMDLFFLVLRVCYFLLLNVMELLGVVGDALLDRSCMVCKIMYVLCLWSQWAYRCSFHMLCLCFCMSEVISSFRSVRAGSQVFALPMLFLCVIL